YCRVVRGLRRYRRPRLSARPPEADPEPHGRLDSRARAFVDAHLSPDGGGSRRASRGPVSRGRQMNNKVQALVSPRNLAVAAIIAFLALLPLYTQAGGNPYLLSLFTRIVILAMAAVSLNLIMGFGGMVSFGHAAYIGLGGYTVGILAHEGIASGLIQWPVALAVSALFALAIGAFSLRTRGVYFIMITLAFAQMIYYA